MKIIQLQAENVKKLRAIEIKPDGNVVKITGKNEQGKTTVLDSIWWALGGTKNIQEQPIRKGESKASITLDLGDMIVTRKFTGKGTTLEVKNKDGLKYPSPQDMLDKLIGKCSFDPLGFARGKGEADKKRRVETLLSIVNIEIDPVKLKEITKKQTVITGNALDTLNSVYKAIYAERTEINRDLDRAKKAYDHVGDVEEAHQISIAELIADKERMETSNRENEAKRQAATAMQRSISDKVEQAERLRQQLEQLEASIKNDEAELAKQDAEIKELVEYDLTDINAAIASADETNEKAQTWKEQQQKKADISVLQKDYDDLTSRLDGIKAYKKELVVAAKFPIKGLDFGGGGVLYNGVPFEQASAAQKWQVSLSIAMALNPDLRVIRIEDASLLDSEHMATIEKMAKDKDFQVWMECVDETGAVGVYIEDGEIKAVNTQTA